MSHIHDMPARSDRQARLFARYRASGSTLPFHVWVKHDQAEQASDAIALPASFWWAVTVVAVCVGITGVVIGRAAGWW